MSRCQSVGACPRDKSGSCPQEPQACGEQRRQGTEAGRCNVHPCDACLLGHWPTIPAVSSWWSCPHPSKSPRLPLKSRADAFEWPQLALLSCSVLQPGACRVALPLEPNQLEFFVVSCGDGGGGTGSGAPGSSRSFRALRLTREPGLQLSHWETAWARRLPAQQTNVGVFLLYYGSCCSCFAAGLVCCAIGRMLGSKGSCLFGQQHNLLQKARRACPNRALSPCSWPHCCFLPPIFVQFLYSPRPVSSLPNTRPRNRCAFAFRFRLHPHRMFV